MTAHYHVLTGLRGCYLPDSNLPTDTLESARAITADWIRECRNEGRKVRTVVRGEVWNCTPNGQISIDECSEISCWLDIHDVALPHWFDLETFLNGFVEGLLWAGVWHADGSDEPLDHSHDLLDFAIDAQHEIISDCIDFASSATRDCPNSMQDREREAGINFYLTRCGHGAGFWDGDWGLDGSRLTELSKPYGNIGAFYTDDKTPLEIHG